MLPFVLFQRGQARSQLVGVAPHQDVGANSDGLLMLSIVVERDAGHAIKRRLLGHIARVGHYALGMSGKPAKLKIGQRIGNMQPCICTIQLAHHFAGHSAKRGYHAEACLHHQVEHLLQSLLIG